MTWLDGNKKPLLMFFFSYLDAGKVKRGAFAAGRKITRIISFSKKKSPRSGDPRVSYSNPRQGQPWTLPALLMRQCYECLFLKINHSLTTRSPCWLGLSCQSGHKWQWHEPRGWLWNVLSSFFTSTIQPIHFPVNPHRESVKREKKKANTKCEWAWKEMTVPFLQATCLCWWIKCGGSSGAACVKVLCISTTIKETLGPPCPHFPFTAVKWLQVWDPNILSPSESYGTAQRWLLWR